MIPIKGPVWKNECHHPPKSYIGSFRVFSRGSKFEEYDLYIFDDPGRQGVCIRAGDDGPDYMSPGEPVNVIKRMVALSGAEDKLVLCPVYAAAAEMLLKLGVFKWVQTKQREELDLWPE